MSEDYWWCIRWGDSSYLCYTICTTRAGCSGSGFSLIIPPGNSCTGFVKQHSFNKTFCEPTTPRWLWHSTSHGLPMRFTWGDCMSQLVLPSPGPCSCSSWIIQCFLSVSQVPTWATRCMDCNYAFLYHLLLHLGNSFVGLSCYCVWVAGWNNPCLNHLHLRAQHSDQKEYKICLISASEFKNKQIKGLLLFLNF